MTPGQKLLKKIRAHDAVVAIYGLGYVGLPLALRFVEAGFSTIGFDTDRDKVAKLCAGKSYIERIADARIAQAIADGLLVTHDYALSARADALIICVPTPLGEHRTPDLSYVLNTVDNLVPHLQPGTVVSLESTTYPGTTEEELLPRIQSRGLVVGQDVFLVYSPEREDPGNPDFNTRTIAKICGGHTAHCLEVGVALYGAVIDRVVPVSSTQTAEMTKLLENIYRAVNIGMVNEMKMVAERMGIDIFEVIDAAATKPFGFTPFYPGPGLGGHCIPIDPFYLAWKAKQCGIDSRFIALAGEVNAAMPAWYVEKAMRLLSQSGQSVAGAAVLILGVSYKKNMDDLRESPALKIIDLLLKQGAKISYADPHVPRIGKLRDYEFDWQSETLSGELLEQSDLVIVCTDHDQFDYALIKEKSRLLLDTRGVFRGLRK